MSTSSDSAEEIVRLSLEGFEVVAKLSGSMAKNLAVMLYAISKDTNKKTKGRTRLTNMLKSNSNLTIFSIKKEDYKDFKKEAKRYGILYCAVFNKNSKTSDGLVDLVIREEDSVRVNRVVERYNITKVDVEKVEKELDETNIESTGNTEKPEIEKDIQETVEKAVKKTMVKNNIINNVFDWILKIALIIGLIFIYQQVKPKNPDVKPVDGYDMTIENNGIFGFTAADFEEVSLGQATRQHLLIVNEQ